jgi:hypothetical protein
MTLLPSIVSGDFLGSSVREKEGGRKNEGRARPGHELGSWL